MYLSQATYRWLQKQNSDLEDVESFELNVATFLLQQVHHQLEIVSAANVACHDGEVVTIQQQFTQQLHTHTHCISTRCLKKVLHQIIIVY